MFYYNIINNILLLSLFAGFDIIHFECFSVVISQSVSLFCSSSLICHMAFTAQVIGSKLSTSRGVSDQRFHISKAEFRIAY